MKSLKSLFATLAIVSLTFACSAVTETPVSQAPDTTENEIIPADNAVFSGGNDPVPVITKPKV